MHDSSCLGRLFFFTLMYKMYTGLFCSSRKKEVIMKETKKLSLKMNNRPLFFSLYKKYTHNIKGIQSTQKYRTGGGTEWTAYSNRNICPFQGEFRVERAEKRESGAKKKGLTPLYPFSDRFPVVPGKIKGIIQGRTRYCRVSWRTRSRPGPLLPSRFSRPTHSIRPWTLILRWR